jgi:hypothetical protein
MKSKILNILSLLLVITAGVAAWADKIQPLGLVPEKFAWLWPFILVGSALVNRVALLIGDALDDGALNDSFKVLLFMFALTVLTACVTDQWGNRRLDPVAVDAISHTLKAYEAPRATPTPYPQNPPNPYQYAPYVGPGL